MTTVSPTSSQPVTPVETNNIAQKSLAQNFDNFLHLLTMQLTHQDPTQPMDTNQFTQQLVQFANIEQAINQNKKLDSLVSLLQGDQRVAGVAYIGRVVEAEGSKTDLVDGNAAWTYTLPEKSAKTVVLVRNSAGNSVAAFPGETGVGKHRFVWDGKDSDGKTMPDGTYQMAVTALDSKGSSMVAPTAILGRVSGVEMADGKLQLAIGKTKIPFDSVQAVTND